MEIQGKVALVTGGATRVGKAITLMLAGAGANVIVNYNTSASAAATTVAEAQALGVDAFAIQCDVSEWASVQRMADAVIERFGGLDILVNSASDFSQTPIPTMEMETWHRVTRVSIDGTFYVTNAFIPSMLGRGGGAIVNIIDLSAWQPWSRFTAHAVGKAGMLALTRQFALELAPTIRVNALASGPVLPPDNHPQESIERVASRTLLKRWGTPADAANAVRYLIEADFVTGSVLVVDGGEHLV
ncbi:MULTISPECIES: SDR family NAD(P)-dependent oxidoreductase [Caldilinea]|jgi:NAD(P)-dependent dehydrogenase (short-subunit alcohol dehydrogenase family)|nr:MULTISPECIES: SDR family oxidoreductase [Caldilinea]MBO9391499.1 SDR family oxidoreductase [Caldilinea sp.]GIV75200.1 MAG: beta-ketoacyl-ACP reductase [Caldilinea sp.]